MRELAAAVRRRRRLRHRMVFTNGCFDILHVGHIGYLERARSLGTYLVVALNSNRSVRKLKGAGRPINHQRDRARVLAALSCVDYVVIFASERVTPLIRRFRPEIYVKGGDYTLDNLHPEERTALEACGSRIRLLPLWPGYSTTKLIRCLRR